MYKGFVDNRKVAGFPFLPQEQESRMFRAGQNYLCNSLQKFDILQSSDLPCFQTRMCIYHPKPNSSQMPAYEKILPSLILK